MTSGQVRLVHIIPIDGVGGVEVAARSLAEACPDQLDLALVLLAGRTIARKEAKVIESPFRSALNPLAQIRAAWISLRLRPDVLTISLWRSIPVGLLVKLLRPRTRLVYFLNADRAVHFADALMSRFMIAFADALWADSKATLDKRLGRADARGRVISFVTHRLTPAQPTAPRPSPRFVTWSRLNHQKGIDLALKLIAELAAAGLDPHFAIWGPDGGEEQKLRRLAAELGIASQVSFEGPAAHEALPEIAGKASFFLQLSRFEGMAMSVVEAMQSGLVPVVTPVGEIPHYVEDGISGLIVDPSDPAGAVRRIAELLSHPDRYEQMRRAAIARWEGAAMYRDDVEAAARALAAGKGTDGG